MSGEHLVREELRRPRVRMWVQRPISWCVTHNSALGHAWPDEADWRETCEVSEGGPDHQWWKDE